MKISHNWLKEYIDVKLTPEVLADKLSMLGLEVASFEDLSKKYAGFVVGEVLEKTKHPNADKLSHCKVNVGKEVLEIVCGGPNVAAGQKVAVALNGATIPHNQHDSEGKPFVIQRVKIRGVESNGMICSAYELDLGDDAQGILVLDEKAKPGTPLAKYLGMEDVVYEMEVTANRGDWLSHIGVAREIQTLTKKKAKLPSVKIRESKSQAVKAATIKILDPQKCRRYSSRVLHNVKVQPSPKWLQDRLSAVGVRPINNIVDVTNYVLMETGQPLHAFDYDRLAKHTIIVKRANDGDTFTTLDGKARKLSSDILMICDGERQVAIAGVMGGSNSEISETTTSVLIESANFDPSSVRRTSKFLGLSTDASQRFERSVDVEMTVYAAHRAAQLIQELTGAEVLRDAIDVYPKKAKVKQIRLRVKHVNDVLGTNLSAKQIVDLLKLLDVAPVSQSKEAIVLRVPTFRPDVVEEIDLIEEVARVYGYDNIETKTRATVDFSKPLVTGNFQDELRNYLVGAGFNEMLTFSLLEDSTASLAGGNAINVLNPVSLDASALRTSLVAGALQVTKHNRYHGEQNLRLFEIGNVFSLKNSQMSDDLADYQEEERLILLLTGHPSSSQYGAEEREVEFFDLKGEVEALLNKFSLDKYSFISYDSDNALIESGLKIEINGTYAGFFGKIAKSIAKRFDIDEAVFVAELRTKVIEENLKVEKKFKELPKFPSVRRDLAFVVDVTLPQRDVERTMLEAGGTLLNKLVLFDVYVGDQVGAGKKSLAYALEFQPFDRTLTDKEADELVGKIVEHTQRKCNAKLRS
ncbi:MAG: phenylalanine--tRNA ligase subunit beta [Ignavibacteriales bacterium]|nr:phenylalanine--tRNA ligase subunit beta [Ignavibacteriales bacterium]